MKDKAQPASVPAGWKLVPVEPTLAMLDALRADTTPYLPDRYRAMLAASPQAPQPEAQPGLTLEQEPKYTVNGHAIVNRASGEEIPADEPVFIFRARDVHARAALAAYSCMLTPGGHREAVAQRLADFAAFSYGNPKRMKEPDTAAPSAQAEPQQAEDELVRLCPDVECSRKGKCSRIVGLSCISRADTKARAEQGGK